jgi:adenylate kinase family enzyme
MAAHCVNGAIRMNIVIEGCDASGKSTLARQLLRAKLGSRILHSDGPPKYEGEINVRADKFMRSCDTICDRHPCVGEEIYYILRKPPVSTLDPAMKQCFYDSKPLIIYCRGVAGSHVARKGEDPAHLKSIQTNHAVIQGRYDQWALEKAHFLYRVGDDLKQLIAAIKGVMDP